MQRVHRAFVGVPWTLAAIVNAALVLSACGTQDRLGPEGRSTISPGAPAHPNDVLSNLDFGSIPREIREELGLVVVDEYPETGWVKLSSQNGISSDELRALLDRRLGYSTLPDLEMECPEASAMTLAFSDGRNSYADFEGQGIFDQIGSTRSGRYGKKIRVAILDTGIDLSHPVFEGRFKKGYDFIDDDHEPWEVADGIDDDGDGLVDEAYGHGTHIAGLIAQIAPECELLVYRVLDSDGRGSAIAVAEAVEEARKDKADIINLSLGMYSDFEPLYEAIVKAERKKIVLVASMGNDASDLPRYPAAYDEVVAVGSVDGADRFSSFSNTGPYMDTTSPGESVLSCAPGGGYVVWSGTSMSTGVVSGALALLAEQLKSHAHLERMREILFATGPEVEELSSGRWVRRVDVPAALELP